MSNHANTENSNQGHKNTLSMLIKSAQENSTQRARDPGLDPDTVNVEGLIDHFKGLRPVGWSVLVRLVTKPQKTATYNYISTDEEHKDQAYRGFMGLVLSVAPGAYKGDEYKDTGPWCKVGDYIIFPRTAGYYLFDTDDGHVLYGILEHAVNFVVDDIKLVKSLSR